MLQKAHVRGGVVRCQPRSGDLTVSANTLGVDFAHKLAIVVLEYSNCMTILIIFYQTYHP